MLDKPRNGWAKISVNGKYIGSASYLTFVPAAVLEPCIRYLQTAKEENDRYGGYGFRSGFGLNISFDAEGYSFGIVEIGDEMYTFTNLDCPHLKELKEYGCEFVKSLMAEAVADIEAEFEDWCWWDAFSESDAEKNKEDILTLIAEAKECLCF